MAKVVQLVGYTAGLTQVLYALDSDGCMWQLQENGSWLSVKPPVEPEPVPIPAPPAYDITEGTGRFR